MIVSKYRNDWQKYNGRYFKLKIEYPIIVGNVRVSIAPKGAIALLLDKYLVFTVVDKYSKEQMNLYSLLRFDSIDSLFKIAELLPVQKN